VEVIKSGMNTASLEPIGNIQESEQNSDNFGHWMIKFNNLFKIPEESIKFKILNKDVLHSYDIFSLLEICLKAYLFHREKCITLVVS